MVFQLPCLESGDRFVALSDEGMPRIYRIGVDGLPYLEQGPEPERVVVEAKLGAQIELRRTDEPFMILGLHEFGRGGDGSYAIFKDLTHFMEHRR